MDHEDVNLGNLCGGAIEEVFQREFAAVLANIADVNTDAEAKRKIVLEFTIAPFEDRSGAQVTFACKSKTVPTRKDRGRWWLVHEGSRLRSQHRFEDQCGACHGPRR
jgi:hypothetical protein